MWPHTIVLGLLAGLIGLDRRAFFQVMVSNPLVAAPVVGLYCGNGEVGFWIGAIASLLWIHELPVGASIPPNDTLVAVVATALASMLIAQAHVELSSAVVVALLWAVPFGVLAQRLDAMTRRLNVALSRLVVKSAAPVQPRMLARAQWVGVGTAFAADVLCAWVALGIGFLVLPLVAGLLTERVSIALRLVFYLLPLVGVATGIATINRRRPWWIVVAIFVMFNIVSQSLGH